MIETINKPPFFKMSGFVVSCNSCNACIMEWEQDIYLRDNRGYCSECQRETEIWRIDLNG